MLYPVIGTIVREVKETIELVIEADDPEEAQDIAYEVLSEYPINSIPVERLRVLQRIGSSPTGIALEFQRTEQEEVFDSEND